LHTFPQKNKIIFYLSARTQLFLFYMPDFELRKTLKKMESKPCAQCSTTANSNSKKCGKCKFMFYCSKECQRKHWMNHKPFCKPMPIRTPIQVDDIEELCLRQWSESALERSKHCSCAICAAECTQLPGLYSPQQIIHDLEQKGPSIFESMTQDYRIMAGPHDTSYVTFFLRPALKIETGGTRCDTPKTGQCVHLGPHGCTLNRENMPTGCLLALPCTTRGARTQNKVNICRTWMSQDANYIIELFEQYQSQKKLSVGCEDEQFIYNVRLQRMARLFFTQRIQHIDNNAFEDELRNLGCNAEKDLKFIITQMKKNPFSAKDYSPKY
jgi:hypothetical protein